MHEFPKDLPTEGSTLAYAELVTEDPKKEIDPSRMKLKGEYCCS